MEHYEIRKQGISDLTTNNHKHQRWSRGHKARGHGQELKKNPRPRPRTALPRTDPLGSKDRNARGQGARTQAQVFSKKQKREDRPSRDQEQECSRPRTKDTGTSVFQKKKEKKGLQKFFSGVLQKIFLAIYKILTIQKIVQSSSRGQGNFRGFEVSRPRPRT